MAVCRARSLNVPRSRWHEFDSRLLRCGRLGRTGCADRETNLAKERMVIDMKLAEALTERKSLMEKLARLRARLAANARVQEGDEPAEKPDTLLSEVDAAAVALGALIVRINRTNVSVTLEVEPRLTLMEAIAQRDMLRLRFAALTELVAAAEPSPRHFALTRSEVRSRPTVDVAALQMRVDALAREIRELDTRLQAANWAVELAD